MKKQMKKTILSLLTLAMAHVGYSQCTPTIVSNGCSFANPVIYKSCNNNPPVYNCFQTFDWTKAVNQALVFQNSGGKVGISTLYNSGNGGQWDNGMEFYTGGDFRMRLNKYGQLGIHTALPAAQLHVGAIHSLSAGYNPTTMYPVPSAASSNGGEELQDQMGLLVNSYRVNAETSLSNTVYDKSYTDLVSMGWNCTNNSALGGSVMRFFTNNTTDTYGVERMRIERDGKIGIGTRTPGYSLDITGDFNVSGNAYCTSGSWSSSDMRFKDHISKMDDLTSKLMKINGYSYQFKTEEFPAYNFNKGNQFGFLAQELQKEFPEMVSTDANGYLAVKYEAMIPVLTEVIKKQEEKIQKLEQEMNAMKASKSESGKNGEMKLMQNNPNPFTENTTISYSIPQSTVHAKIVIYNMGGSLVKSYDLDSRNNGTLTINGGELKAGSYIYTLVADGQSTESKVMVLIGK
jgi:hypothetical protein